MIIAYDGYHEKLFDHINGRHFVEQQVQIP